mmetsp:Transcript_120110/g.339896  ORF Transcript_120110/g.339896 Transcript_120110/m.339896 type:complete len:109 (-) Transcript_120110:509-835(-)
MLSSTGGPSASEAARWDFGLNAASASQAITIPDVTTREATNQTGHAMYAYDLLRVQDVMNRTGPTHRPIGIKNRPKTCFKMNLLAKSRGTQMRTSQNIPNQSGHNTRL